MTRPQRDRLKAALGYITPDRVKSFFQLAEIELKAGRSFSELERLARHYARVAWRVRSPRAYYAHGRLEMFAAQIGAAHSRATAVKDKRVSPIAKALAEVMG